MSDDTWRQGEMLSARKLNEKREVFLGATQIRGDGAVTVQHVGGNIIIGLDIQRLIQKIGGAK